MPLTTPRNRRASQASLTALLAALLLPPTGAQATTQQHSPAAWIPSAQPQPISATPASRQSANTPQPQLMAALTSNQTNTQPPAQPDDEDDAPDLPHFRHAFPDGPQRQFIDAVLLGAVPGALAAAKTLPDGVNTVGQNNHTALEAAAWKGDLQMVQALLSAGANANGAPDRAPIGVLFSNGDTDRNIAIAQLLVKSGANVDGTSYGDTLTRYLASHGRLQPVSALVALHASINGWSSRNTSPLLSAAAAGYWEVVDWLLQHGGSIWATDNTGSNLGSAVQTALAPRIQQVTPEPEKQALNRVATRLKNGGFPQPAPAEAQVRAQMAAGHWPPNH